MADQEILDSIPHRPPFLFVDRVVEQKERGIVCARKFDGNEDFYKGHYPNAPLTPGVLLCESVFQTAAVYLVKKARAAGTADFENRTPVLCRVENAKFKSMVFPGDEIFIEVSEIDELSGFYHMSGTVKTARGVALQIKFAITMLDKEPARQ
ncbi:MAG: beta-hydroxyacyl-ACP dehydratase [Opitutales bacterium]|nr:beta-hydroxyacyl-ACP dehydratase [Opitutales bacterium]